MSLIDVHSPRATEARLGKLINPSAYRALQVGAGLFVVAAIALGVISDISYALLLLSPAILCYMPTVWWKRQLSVVPPTSNDLNGRMSVDILSRITAQTPQNPQGIWQAINGHWQARFITHHLLLSEEVIIADLSTESTDLEQALNVATLIADQSECQTIELGFVVAGLLLTSPQVKQHLVQLKIQPDDVSSIAYWLGRNVVESTKAKRSNGGIGRDWAFGFTPLLNRFGHNLSLEIERYNAHFDALSGSAGVESMVSAFANGTGAVALIGPDGIGKTTSVHAFAQRLIEGNASRNLSYHQVIALNATDITANARKQGDLEQIMLSLSSEASHAGHIVLFFDDAQMFFGGAPGSFDGTQILLSIIQANSVQMILAMSSSDFQRLKASNQALASLLTPVVLQELPEDGVMRVLEDKALSLENRHGLLVTYESLHEAYRLSGRYEQDEAYPGKAIKLLEQAVTYAENSAVTDKSVQKAIEQTHGVKVSAAAPAEVNELLNLEAKIHERMINQASAVSVVANALRRARAGVANPRRPIGSFLFLGPTGVGKTELAKAIAATYFGAESNMLRLDMSEYQQPEDVKRLLSDGQSDTMSLIMAVRQQPFSVVLLDEIEKAHPNILNLLLQLLDEGQLTDNSGRVVSFKDCVIICTSNAGAQTIRERVQKGEAVETFQSELTDELISSGQFKPELLNRFDETVLFRPLDQSELSQVVGLMMNEINQTLSNQNITVQLTPAAIEKIVETGYDPRLGARPMRRTLQKAVENTVAQRILKGETNPGDQVQLDVGDLEL
ncbi:MAG: AAA family ATPase [Patescibacteria group bacterium]